MPRVERVDERHNGGLLEAPDASSQGMSSKSPLGCRLPKELCCFVAAEHTSSKDSGLTSQGQVAAMGAWNVRVCCMIEEFSELLL